MPRLHPTRPAPDRPRTAKESSVLALRHYWRSLDELARKTGCKKAQLAEAMKKALGVDSIHDLTASEISDQAWEMEARAAEIEEPKTPPMMNHHCYSALVDRWQEKLTAQEMHFCALLIHAHDDTHVSAFAFPGLALLWGCDLRHAKTKVSRLRELGVLIVGKEEGAGRPRNTYRLECCPDIAPMGSLAAVVVLKEIAVSAPQEDPFARSEATSKAMGGFSPIEEDL